MDFFETERVVVSASAGGIAVHGMQWRSQEFDWGVGGVYVLTSHCNFKTCYCPTREQNGYWFGGVYIPIYGNPRRYGPVLAWMMEIVL